MDQQTSHTSGVKANNQKLRNKMNKAASDKMWKDREGEQVMKIDAEVRGQEAKLCFFSTSSSRENSVIKPMDLPLSPEAQDSCNAEEFGHPRICVSPCLKEVVNLDTNTKLWLKLFLSKQ